MAGPSTFPAVTPVAPCAAFCFALLRSEFSGEVFRLAGNIQLVANEAVRRNAGSRVLCRGIAGCVPGRQLHRVGLCGDARLNA